MAQTFKRPPSCLDHTQFVTLYGRVYEHSPWIAEAAWAMGLTPQHDTVEGLHEALAAIVNAVWHATGVRVRDLPVRLDKLLGR